jgi:hypothetical protein
MSRKRRRSQKPAASPEAAAPAVTSQVVTRFVNEVTTATEVGPTTGIRTSPTFRSFTRKRSTYDDRKRVNTSRFLDEELPFVGYLNKQLPEEALGDGLVVTSASKNEAWRTKATEYFDLWASSTAIDVQRQFNFYTAQPMLGHMLLRDGEPFIQKVRSDDTDALSRKLEDKSFRALQLQFFRRDQIGNGNTKIDDSWHDGIQVNELGRAVTYRILQGDRFIDRPAAVMLHLKEPDLDSIHGTPWGFRGEKSSLDNLDLKALEKFGAKVRAAFLGAITTPSGDAPRSMRPDVKKGTDSAGADNGIRYYEMQGGVRIPIFAQGEQINFFTGQPAISFAELTGSIIFEIARAYGYPPEYLVNLQSLGSAAARMLLRKVAKGHNRIRRPFREIYCQGCWEFVIGDAIQREQLELVDDWNVITCKPSSPDPSIDAGRDERAEQDRLRSFTGTVEEYCDLLGKDGVKTRHGRIDEIADNIRYGQVKHNLPWFLCVEPQTLQAIAGIASAMHIDLAAIGEQLKTLGASADA